jgi:hypothetical protein
MAFFYGMLGTVAVLSVGWAVRSIGRGEFPTAIVVLCVAVSMSALIASSIMVMSGKVSARAQYDDRETTIRPRRALDWLTKGGTLTGYVAMAAYAIFTPMGKIDIPQPPGNHQYLWYAAAGGAIWGIVDLWRTFRRGGVSFVRLSPSGFAMSQGSSSMGGEWDDVTDIADRRPGKSPPLRGMLFVLFGDGRVRGQVVDSYTPGGDAMRRWVRYYWINPERRDELADARAVERLAEFERRA